jgi:glucan phosphoethanolaminetransferase (alkaline phosphatase superfamily)
MEALLKFVGAFVLVVGLVFVIAAVMAFPTMWLMNYLFTPSLLKMVFGITTITFWKAFWFNLFMGLVVKSSTTSKKD